MDDGVAKANENAVFICVELTPTVTLASKSLYGQVMVITNMGII